MHINCITLYYFLHVSERALVAGEGAAADRQRARPTHATLHAPQGPRPRPGQARPGQDPGPAVRLRHRR